MSFASPFATPSTFGWYFKTVDTTPTYTVNGSLSFPWLSTALRTTAQLPDAVALPGVSVNPETIFIVGVPYGLSDSFVTLSSASPTVTRFSSIALVILVPDGNTLRAPTLLASVPL